MAYRSPTTSGLSVAPNAAIAGGNPAAEPDEMQGHCWWGRWATAAVLPNASGAPATGAAYEALRPGDLAFAQDTGGLLQLVDRGTNAGGDAVWTPAGGAGGSTMEIIEGFTTTDYYQSAPDQLPGAPLFTAIWLGMIGPPVAGAGQQLLGNNNGSGQGWSIGKGGKPAGSIWYLGCGCSDGVGTPGVNEGSDGGAWGGGQIWQPAHLTIIKRATALEFYLDGDPFRFSGEVAGAGFTPAAGSRFHLGGGPDWWNEPQVMGGVAGAAYIASAITPQQVSAHWNACRNAGFRMAQGAVAWEHRYDLRAPGGSFPAQIDDLEGTAHLSRVGVALVATTEQAF